MDDLFGEPVSRYLHPVRLGTVELPVNTALAPMAGFTNTAFRRIVKQLGGCGLVATEMIAALDPLPERAAVQGRFRAQVAHDDEEHPVAMQVYGRDPERCARCAAALVAAGADVVDLNCGCPVRKAKQAGCGVALMREPDQVQAIVAAMRRAVRVPLGVKMRLGADAGHRNAVELARIVVGEGADFITVHARTGEHKHASPVDIAGLAAVREAVAVPLLANGDMQRPANLRAAVDQAGADGIMVGRAACADPWVFRDLPARLRGESPAVPGPDERRRLLEYHCDLVVELYGEERGMRIMRKYAMLYCQGLPGVRRFRERFNHLVDRADFQDLVATFFATVPVV